MKKLVLSITALTFSVLLFAQGSDKKKAADVAKFKSETIDLGKLQQGNPTSAVFSVLNVGTEPLIIEQANPTCGCTIGDYTKAPIMNGNTGEIKATYNAANIGAFEKHLTVKFAGVDEVKSITIKGEVLSKEDYAKLNGTTVPATVEKVTPAADTKTKTEVKPESKKTAKTKTTAETANKKRK